MASKFTEIHAAHNIRFYLDKEINLNVGREDFDIQTQNYQHRYDTLQLILPLWASILLIHDGENEEVLRFHIISYTIREYFIS